MSSSSSGQMRYPAKGFAPAKSGEDIIKSIGAKNISWFGLYTTQEVDIVSKNTSENVKINGNYQPSLQLFLYTFGATVETPHFKRGGTDGIIISSETEFYIVYNSFLREKSSW